MIDISGMINIRERKVLAGISLLAALGLAFYWLVAVKQKDSYKRIHSQKENIQSSYLDLQSGHQETELQNTRWNTALKNLEELRGGYFYSSAGLIQEIRTDMQGLFRKNGITAGRISYQYSDEPEQKIRTISSKFEISGQYALIKKFLYDVEIFPKFLVIERLDFRDINSQTGTLKISLTLTGYYED